MDAFDPQEMKRFFNREEIRLLKRYNATVKLRKEIEEQEGEEIELK